MLYYEVCFSLACSGETNCKLASRHVCYLQVVGGDTGKRCEVTPSAYFGKGTMWLRKTARWSTSLII